MWRSTPRMTAPGNDQVSFMSRATKGSAMQKQGSGVHGLALKPPKSSFELQKHAVSYYVQAWETRCRMHASR